MNHTKFSVQFHANLLLELLLTEPSRCRDGQRFKSIQDGPGACFIKNGPWTSQSEYVFDALSSCSSANDQVITQCEIRKLYAQNREPGVAQAIDLAKTLERRRCGHHPDEYPEPLSTEECFKSVVDPKGTGVNKHRYVVASQEQEVRRMLRGIKGVPLIYIKRSVMILEPMADESVQLRQKEERSKFRAELKGGLGKRKREDKDEDESANEKDEKSKDGKSQEGTSDQKKKKRVRGPKGPNPLAMQKAKKEQPNKQAKPKSADEPDNNEESQDAPAKRKRRRRAKPSSATTGDEQSGAPEIAATADES